MEFAAIADIHGNLTALEAVLADIADRKIATIVILGDMLSGPLQPVETADLLMNLKLLSVRGNHERQLLEIHPQQMGESDSYTASVLDRRHWDWIRSLPSTLVLEDQVLLCHGTPASDLEYFLETVSPQGANAATLSEVEQRAGSGLMSLILCGHTHVPRIVELPDGRTIVNPGSVGLQAFRDHSWFPHRLETGSPHARYAIVKQALGRWTAEFVSVPYDWESTAQLAERNHRQDWAIALRTGRVE